MKKGFYRLFLILIILAACSPLAGGGNPLDGTSWKLASIENTNLIEGRSINIHFNTEQVRGSAGCNTYSGMYRVRGDEILFKDLFTTLMACPQTAGLMEQERQFLSFLSDANRYQLSGDQLLIYRADGKTLTFIRSDGT